MKEESEKRRNSKILLVGRGQKVSTLAQELSKNNFGIEIARNTRNIWRKLTTDNLCIIVTNIQCPPNDEMRMDILTCEHFSRQTIALIKSIKKMVI